MVGAPLGWAVGSSDQRTSCVRGRTRSALLSALLSAFLSNLLLLAALVTMLVAASLLLVRVGCGGER